LNYARIFKLRVHLGFHNESFGSNYGSTFVPFCCTVSENDFRQIKGLSPFPGSKIVCWLSVKWRGGRCPLEGILPSAPSTFRARHAFRESPGGSSIFSSHRYRTPHWWNSLWIIGNENTNASMQNGLALKMTRHLNRGRLRRVLRTAL